jgi:hypothetical protein
MYGLVTILRLIPDLAENVERNHKILVRLIGLDGTKRNWASRIQVRSGEHLTAMLGNACSSIEISIFPTEDTRENNKK